jgi:hypothetical protein
MMKWFKSMFATPKPAGPAQVIKRFSTEDSTISRDCVVEDDSWLFICEQPQTVNLFEFGNPGIEQCILTYKAQIRTEGLSGRTYLEMWCKFAGKGEYFSKGFNQALTGTNDWAKREIPFLLKKGQKPDVVKLNVAVEGNGKVWIKDIELLKTPIE